MGAVGRLKNGSDDLRLFCFTFSSSFSDDFRGLSEMEKSSPFLSFHHPKRQINPRLLDAGAFQDGVQPVFLRFAMHHNELAVFQPHFAFFLAFFVFEGEFARCAEAEGGDGTVFDQPLPFVAVPRHAFVAVVVAVEQAGVEAGGADVGDGGFHAVFEFGQDAIPRQGDAVCAGITVVVGRVAVPRNFAGSDDVLAEYHGFVVPPGNITLQNFKITVGFGDGENPSEIADDAVVGQEVGVRVGGFWEEVKRHQRLPIREPISPFCARVASGSRQ